MIKPDDTVVDLGAGIGDFAIKATRRAKKVIAVEPNQQDFELLLRNLRANGCHNVVRLAWVWLRRQEWSRSPIKAGRILSM
jgi:FkbM family methyltransferase